MRLRTGQMQSRPRLFQGSRTREKRRVMVVLVVNRNIPYGYSVFLS